MELHTALIAALASMGVALLAGKALRRLVLLPFEWLAGKTSTKVDDILVGEAEKDLGIDKPTLEDDNAPKAEK